MSKINKMYQLGKSDEEYAKALQAEFDKDFHNARKQEEDDLKFAQSLADYHQISDSDSDESVTEVNVSKEEKKQWSQSDSDRTLSEDELEVIQAKGKCKPQESPTEIKSPVNKMHEISDSEGEPENVTQSNNSSSKITNVPLHDLSDSGPEDVQVANEAKASTSLEKQDARPVCKFGKDCYRKSAAHLRHFQHPSEGYCKQISEGVPNKKIKLEEGSKQVQNNGSEVKRKKLNTYRFYMTTVKGIPNEYNENGAMGIKDILSYEKADLIASAQFNYMHEIEWLVHQYPPEFRSRPLLIVHGEQRESKKALTQECSSYSNISLSQAKLEIMYGTHHTKMMLLLYNTGLRVVIHTANNVSGDWCKKSQGGWFSPLFPKLKDGPSSTAGESPTQFKRDFLEYLSAYNTPEINQWCDHIRAHDLSKAQVFLIGSVPGRHVGPRRTSFGHLKLKKVLQQNGPSSSLVDSRWSVISQFSSIGSLGAKPDAWLLKEFISSLNPCKGNSTSTSIPKLKLIFPSVENVRMSLEGYPAGGALPYSIEVARKQPWLNEFFHQWKSSKRGRTHASPHIKSYCRVSPDNAKVAWFLVTSANLSKAAWGALEKNGSQLMIRSYELGVLFLPQYFKQQEVFYSPNMSPSNAEPFPLPFDIPLSPYAADDEPWIWNIPHTDGPDRFMNVWSPS